MAPDDARGVISMSTNSERNKAPTKNPCDEGTAALTSGWIILQEEPSATVTSDEDSAYPDSKVRTVKLPA
jgi:hypothetical protein